MTAARSDIELPLTEEEQNRLILNHQGLVRKLTSRMLSVTNGVLERDDVSQCAEMGLIEAAKSYRKARGAFRGFAWLHMSGRVMREVRYEHRHRQKLRAVANECMALQHECGDPLTDTPEMVKDLAARHNNTMVVALLLGLAAEASLAAADEQGGEALVIKRELVEAVNEAVESLEPVRRRLIRMRYWEAVKMKDIAAELDLGDSTLRRHHNAALEQLGELIRQHGIDRSGN